MTGCRWIPVALLAAAVPGQGEVPEIAVEDVGEVVSLLASDELAGRDTPSPGLDQAAGYIAEWFEKAGLERAAGDDYFHRYTQPGLRVEHTTVRVELKRRVGEEEETIDLVPGEQVRLLRPGDILSAEDLFATMARTGDPRWNRLVVARAGPRRGAIFVEVPETSPFWRRTEGIAEVLDPVRAGGHPVFMIKSGILPPWTNGEQFSSTFEVPAPERVELRLRNVLGVLRGAELPDEYVLVSSHYDHLGLGRPVGGDAIYNGADDDASGTAAVVVLADALAKGPRPRRSILFACFSGEERGMLGSSAFADRSPIPLEAIVAQVNVEMIGRPLPGHEREAWITGAHLSDFAAIVTPALGRAGIAVVDFEHATRLFFASDNISLAWRGVVAHSISSGSPHTDYHRPSDEVQTLDLSHMAAVIGGLREAVLEIANRDGRPAYSEEGRELLR